jgi:glycosyltransferase involved in cell wall biosynthesis
LEEIQLTIRCIIITDAYPPLATSAAVQVRDLAIEFVRQGHQIVVITPDSNVSGEIYLQSIDGVQIVKIRTPRIKNVGYLRRAFGEFIMPFAMYYRLRSCRDIFPHWDLIAWYSPSIFNGILARLLSQSRRCKRYLILRDIFPEWAADVGLITRGIPYYFFKAVANFQYSVADVIGVQSSGNLWYFKKWAKRSGRRLEVLNNWLGEARYLRCGIRLDKSLIAGRKIFVHAGNIGVAQGVLNIINAASYLSARVEIGFLFVGRGSDFERMRKLAASLGLSNVEFFGEVPADEIPDLFSQCYAGIVSLDLRHKTQNVPGKFLSYLRSGLPVLANVNSGNNICDLIVNERIGRFVSTEDPQLIADAVIKLVSDIENDFDIHSRCVKVFERDFSVDKAVKQIVEAVGK